MVIIQDKLVSNKMKMGIFWFYNRQVLGIAHDINLNDIDSLGLVDSPFTHVDYWQKIKSTRSELHDVEYEDIPRGRIVYNHHRHDLIIYLDETLLNKLIVNQIVEFFQLQPVTIKISKDLHYQTKRR